MPDKPEALRWAERLERRRLTRWVHATGETPRASGYVVDQDCAEAAAELRRLVAENERLHQINQSHEMKLSVRGYEIQIADLKAANAELLERADPTQTACDIAEDGVCEVIDCCRNPAQILEALEIGYDSAQAEAAQYHAAMAGYRPERHAAMDADVQKIAKAITAVKAALAQPDRAPFGYIWPTERHPEFRYTQQMRSGVAGMPLYTHPPRREWQSLTEEEREQATGWSVEHIEAKLKEKNNA